MILGSFRGVRALLVEDDSERAAWMVRQTPGAAWERARNDKEALRFLAETAAGRRAPYAVVFLDFDLHGPSGGGGQRVADALIRGGYRGVVVVHSTNVVGGPVLVQMLAYHGIDVIYAPAFLNRDSPDRWRWALQIAASRPTT